MASWSRSITPRTAPALLEALGGSRGVDVTGGMSAKVLEMLRLVETVPGLREVHMISGLVPGLMRDVLLHPDLEAGTRILK